MTLSTAQPQAPTSTLPWTPEQTGNGWLLSQLAEAGAQIGRHDVLVPITDQAIGFLAIRVLKTTAGSMATWELSKIFPTRSLTAADVKPLSEEQLLELPAPDFLAIADLINDVTGMLLLKRRETAPNAGLALTAFNPHLAETFASQQRALIEVAVEEPVKAEADQLLPTLKRYSEDEITASLGTAAFEPLKTARLVFLPTEKRPMIPNTPYFMEQVYQDCYIERYYNGWDAANAQYLAQGIPTPVTTEWLASLNTVLNNAPSSQTGKPAGTLPAIRGPRQEHLSPNMKHELPGYAVKAEIDRFVRWLNAELAKCDANEANPIVVASQTYQILLSFVPFSAANLATAGLVADCVLRRYGLLPAAWTNSAIDLGISPLNERNPTPTSALTQMLEAVKHSYALVG